MSISDHLQCGETNILVYVIVTLFGIGSWVAVNGLWVELPILVEHLPEGWYLPSYLTIIIQLANIGPVAFTIANAISPKKVKEKYAACVIILIGVVSTFLLAFYWDKTSVIADSVHSTALFALHFFLALVDCTSSVVFLPFMVTFKSQYITAYFIGEGFSGLLPSIVALGQGVGNVNCVNKTVNGTTNSTEHQLVPEYIDPRFPVDDFFFFLFAMMILSGLAFILLNHMPGCKKEHAHVLTPPGSENSLCDNDYELNDNSKLDAEISESFINPSESSSPSPSLKKNKKKKKRTLSVEVEVVYDISTDSRSLSTFHFIYFLLLIAWINSLTNGVLPSIQSFSCLPYGMSVYHMAVVLANVANPVACFIAFFLPVASRVVITVVTVVGTGFGGYILVLAALSPNPPLDHSITGSILVVAAWVLFQLFLTFAKVSIASVFREEGRRALLWCGAVTQAGSAVGAIVMFVLVNVYSFFHKADLCSS